VPASRRRRTKKNQEQRKEEKKKKKEFYISVESDLSAFPGPTIEKKKKRKRN